ncbi:MAG: sigma-70 family RNA polymerase sigma factor [Ferruginibacter sp.]
MQSKGQDIIVSDRQILINGCLARTRASQRKIYEIFCPPTMGLCLRYAKSWEEAEEILQDGFLQIYKHISQFKNTGSFGGWLRKIMINTALQRYRSRAKLVKLNELTNENSLSYSRAGAEEKMNEKELLKLIQTLPPSYKLVFNLHVFEGMKHREIAELLNVSEGTSKSNLSDARIFLRKRLAPELKLAK